MQSNSPEIYRQLDKVKLFTNEFKIISAKGDFNIPKIWLVVAITKDGLILSCPGAVVFTKFDNVFKIKSSKPPKI